LTGAALPGEMAIILGDGFAGVWMLRRAWPLKTDKAPWR